MEKQIFLRLGQQFFSIPITDINRIIQIEKRIVVPDVSSYVLGVQDLEGKILPLIDLAERFYKKELEDFDNSDVIVVNWKDKKVGLVVDEVVAVHTFTDEKITESVDSDQLNDGDFSSYIRAFIQTEENIVPILHVHALFNDEKANEIRELLKIDGVKNETI